MKRIEHLTDINKVIKGLEDDISDYEWNEQFDRANDLRVYLESLYKLREQGELYVPEF